MDGECRDAIVYGELFQQTMSHARLPLCVTNPREPDNPIIFVNAAFCELTGYSEVEIIGRNCRFLQGPETDPASVERIREIIAKEEVATVEIVNYRKDGRRFLNALQLGPIYGPKRELLHYFGSQLDITEQRAAEDNAKKLADAELRHRLANIVSVLDVIVRLTAQEDLDRAALAAKLSERIHALAHAHISALVKEGSENAYLSEIAETILTAYGPNGRDSFSLNGPETEIRPQAITSLAVVLHELATNAVKHGAFSRPDGRVSLDWAVAHNGEHETLSMTWAETGGPAVAAPERASGSKIVADMVRIAKGSVDYDWRPAGLVAAVELMLPKG